MREVRDAPTSSRLDREKRYSRLTAAVYWRDVDGDVKTPRGPVFFYSYRGSLVHNSWCRCVECTAQGRKSIACWSVVAPIRRSGGVCSSSTRLPAISELAESRTSESDIVGHSSDGVSHVRLRLLLDHSLSPLLMILSDSDG
jgi:hypothetical protein